MRHCLKHRAGPDNEASGSLQSWNPTNVWGDVVGREHGENDAEYWEGGEVLWNALGMQPRTADAGHCS